MRATTLTLVLLVSASTATARTRPSPFKVDPWVDGSLLAVGLTLWITPALVVDGQVVQAPCDPCDPRRLNALDRPVVQFHNEKADRAGDILVALVPSIAVAGTLLRRKEWGWGGALEDATLIAEAMVLAGGLNQMVKFAVRRPRPFMYRAGARPDLRDSADATISFYSGHSSAAFCAATAFAYTYSVRNPRSRLRPLVWVVALLAASTVPVLRVAAGEHFWSDVMVGAAVGGGMGILVPALHRRARLPGGARLRVTPTWAGVEASF